MSNKIIIQNNTGVEDDVAVALVAAVIKEGRISNKGKQYCYATTFKSGVVVWTDLNKRSDRFVIDFNHQEIVHE